MTQHNLITSLMRPFFRKGRTASFTVPGNLGPTSRVLGIDVGDLSDAIFHMPLLAAVKRRYPSAEIDFLVPEEHLDLVARSGLAKECIVYKGGQLNPWRPAYGSLLRKLSERSYDMSVVMSFRPHPRLELGALASGANLRLGPSHDDGWPAVNFEVRPREGAAGYWGDRTVLTAPFLGFAPAEIRPGWPLPDDLMRHAAQQVHFHKPNPDQMLIGVDPGTTKSRHRFAPESWHFVIRQLTSQFVCSVLPLGHPDDRDHLKDFSARLSDIPVGLKRESLLEMLVLLTQCDLFLAGNTDLFHFAVAQGVPTVGLFTEAEAAHFRPNERPRVRVLEIERGEKVDIETLMEAVEAVTEGRASTASTVIADPGAHPSASNEGGTVPGSADV